PALSADGRSIAYASEASNLVADDTNEKADVFVHDLRARPNAEEYLGADLTTVRAPVSSPMRATLVLTAATRAAGTSRGGRGRPAPSSVSEFATHRRRAPSSDRAARPTRRPTRRAPAWCDRTRPRRARTPPARRRPPPR